MEGRKWSISDVVKQTGIEPHVLRYWEKELSLNIPRNEFGYRFYLDKHIELFRQIHEMKDGGFQLKAIKTVIPPEFLYEDENAVVHTTYNAVGSSIAAGEIPTKASIGGGVATRPHTGTDQKNLSKVIIMSKAGDKFEVIKGKRGDDKGGDCKEENKENNKEHTPQNEKVTGTGNEKDKDNLDDKFKNDLTEIPDLEAERIAYINRKEETLAREQDLMNDIREKAEDLLGQTVEDMPKGYFKEAAVKGLDEGEMSLNDPSEKRSDPQENQKATQKTVQTTTQKQVSQQPENLKQVSKKQISKKQVSEKESDQNIHYHKLQNTSEVLVQNNETVELENHKIMQFKDILSDVIVEVLDQRDEKMGVEISDKIIKQMDYLIRLQDQLEEDRFKRLDETIRLYQKEREAVGKQGFFHKLSKKRAGRK